MPIPSHIMTAADIKDIAGQTASSVLPDEAAETVPVPVRIGNGFAIQILFYREFGAPGTRRVQPPDHCMWVHPESGKVLRFWACKPAEIGLENGVPVIPGAGTPQGMTAESYATKEERLLAISSSVWSAFLEGKTPIDPDRSQLAREYRRLFLETTKAEVAGFTVAAASDFFHWLDAFGG